jgi:hypothetical protein
MDRILRREGEPIPAVRDRDHSGLLESFLRLPCFRVGRVFNARLRILAKRASAPGSSLTVLGSDDAGMRFLGAGLAM